MLWTPGNHELWTPPSTEGALRGEAKYRRLVEICRRYTVLTPEDEYPLWLGEGGPAILAPTFLLYDYSFRPDTVTEAGAVAWAESQGVLCSDEYLIHPEPHASTAAWCAERCALTLPGSRRRRPARRW